MGIQHLNQFFKEEANSNDSIKFINLIELTGKKIAIDISIYMYRYSLENALIENMYLMLSLFRHYKIIPIFIFDGKSPPEKQNVLNQRYHEKKSAEDEYNILKNSLTDDMDAAERRRIELLMNKLKRQFIYISKTDTDQVKQLITAYGAMYYDAPREADEVCAILSIKEQVWACLSEDMDMFVYGCPRVIRYISLLNHTAVLYDTKQILENLGISQKELREICIISGTDYNKNTLTSLPKTLKYFKKYFKEKPTHSEPFGFYDWLQKNTHYIKEYPLLLSINMLFDLTTITTSEYDAIDIQYKPVNTENIQKILKEDGFIF